MSVRNVAGVLLGLLCLAALTTRGAAVNELKSQEPQVLTITGRIVSTRNIAGACYLYFGRDVRRSLAAVIFAANRSRFPNRPERYYHSRHVQVSGVARENRGRTEIMVNDPDQITVVEPGKPTTSIPRDQRSIRLEMRVIRLEAEMKNLKKQVIRSERSGPADSAGSDSMGHKLEIELKNLRQQVYDLNKKVRELQDIIAHMAYTRGR